MGAALRLVNAQSAHVRGPLMAPTKTQQNNSDNWFQKEILEKILEVKEGVDESLKLGRANGEALRTLRAELGVDGSYGRLPQLEQAVARLDRRQEDDHKEVCSLVIANQEKAENRFSESGKRQHDATNRLIDRIELLEKDDHKKQGKDQLWEILRTIVTSSASAAAIGTIAKMLGLIH